jgi:hypothetical protein
VTSVSALSVELKSPPPPGVTHGIVLNLEKFQVASPAFGAKPWPVPLKLGKLPGGLGVVTPLVPPAQLVVTSKRRMIRGVGSPGFTPPDPAT